jgi:outer membrane protein TolC
MGKGTPPQQYIHYRRATTVACMLLGVASVVPLADCQSIQTQVSGTHDWSTTLAGGEILGPVDEAALSQWWTVFNDPILTSLEERALKSNLDLRTALSNIEQARANRLSASGSSLPSVSYAPLTLKRDSLASLPALLQRPTQTPWPPSPATPSSPTSHSPPETAL